MLGKGEEALDALARRDVEVIFSYPREEAQALRENLIALEVVCRHDAACALDLRRECATRRSQRHAHGSQGTD